MLHYDGYQWQAIIVRDLSLVRFTAIATNAPVFSETRIFLVKNITHLTIFKIFLILNKTAGMLILKLFGNNSYTFIIIYNNIKMFNLYIKGLTTLNTDEKFILNVNKPLKRPPGMINPFLTYIKLCLFGLSATSCIIFLDNCFQIPFNSFANFLNSGS